ncbi:MAG TPA: O-antigen ligase family protein [Candidatus Didemnitutus sp.]|nr:O-antigen ligase family protein [Candidatus Didemnitutus sp.]
MTSIWETLVIVHVGVLIIGTSWAYGGQVDWARTAIHGWSVIGIGIFVAASLRRERRFPWRDLWPLLAFDVLVGLSCLNPSFRTITFQGEAFFELVDPRWPGLPSSARPDLSATALLLWNGIILSAYNLSLVIRNRRLLRRLLAAIVINAVALAILGTLAKLTRADGLWFGAVATPQSYFFATFVYHNHWAAFTLLNLGACLGLLFHADRKPEGRDTRHSQVPAALVAALVLIATIPLSESRSGSALAILLLGGVGIHFLRRKIRRQREAGRSIAAPVAGISLGAILALGAIGYLARDVIRQRAALTVSQVTAMRTEDTLNSRLTVYRDTWRMAEARPWFGWGFDTYGDVFRIFNSQRSVEGWTPYYREAHNDWLQFLSETGWVGLALLVLTGAVPLWRARWQGSRSPVPRYLLAGCATILVYAAFEFPLANPSVLIGFWTSLFAARAYLDAGSASPAA